MKNAIRLAGLLAIAAVIAACSNPLVAELRAGILADYEEVFWFSDDEIGFDFSYTSADFELNDSTPIYIAVYPVPLAAPASQDDIVFLFDHKITSNGRIVIPRSDLPADQGLFFFVHDLNNSLPDDLETDDNSDTSFIANSQATGGLSNPEDTAIFELDEVMGGPLIVDGNYVFKEEFVLSVGNSYVIEYEDGSNYEADAFEASNDSPGSFRELSQGTYETARNLHAADDVGYLGFTPATSDDYEIRIKATAYNIRVSLYETDSHAVTDTNARASSDGNTTRVINSSYQGLTGGSTYYLRIESPDSGLGPYDIGYFFTPVGADAFENDDSRGAANPLPLGRGNVQSRTLEPTERDWVSLSVQDGFNYIVEVQEDPGFDDSRNPVFGFRLENSGGSGVQGGFAFDSTKRIILDPDSVNYGGAGTYYLQITNDTPVIGDEDYPSFDYSVLYTYGPDDFDEPDNPNTAEDEYALYNEGSNIYAVPWVPYGTDGWVRTIYSVEPGEDPEDDTDWLSFDVQDPWDDIIIKAQPEGVTEPVVVEFAVFPSEYDGADIVPNESASVAEGQVWASDDTIVSSAFDPTPWFGDPHNPSSLERRFWIRVRRNASYPDNPLTGAYRVTVQAGPDEEDSSYTSASDNDFQTDMINASGGVIAGSPFGIDETPYLGIQNQQSPGTDFSNRNRLDWTGSIGNYEIDTVWNSIFRKNYLSRGEPDGVNDPSADWEFYWFQTPASLSEILILGYSSTTPNIPLRLTYWDLTAAEFVSVTADQVVTESDLDAIDTPTVITSSYVTGESSEKIEHTISSVSGGDYYFVKVERDNSRSTYTDSNGDLRTYAETGRYRLLFWD